MSEYQNLQDQVFRLYADRKLEDALKAALQAEEKFPEKQERTSYWVACLYSLLGQSENAIRTLQNATDKGCWWSEQSLIDDNDLVTLRDKAGFKDLLAKCKEKRRLAESKSQPDLLVETPPGYSPYRPTPAIVALHPRGGNARDFANHWRPALKAGLILVLPQSSQPYSSQSFSWDSLKRSEKDLVRTYWRARASCSMDPAKVVLAGFSQGGERAISMALRQIVPCNGFVVVAPSIRNPDNLTPWVETASAREMRGYIFSGEKDFAYSNTKRFSEDAEKKGMSCMFHTETKLGHEFPQDFRAKLASAISFVLA